MAQPKSKSINLLSARKQEQVKQAIQNVIDAGVQYNLNYVAFEKYHANIDTPEKRDAIKYILGDLIEIAELNFQMSPIIEMLGDPETIESLNYREFKLLQEIIKNVRIKGRDNHVRLSRAMKAFNEDGSALDRIEQESKIFMKQYQEAGAYYSKLCRDYEIFPEDLDAQVEEAFNAKRTELGI